MMLGKRMRRGKELDALIKNQETLKDLQLVLVQHRPPDLVIQLFVGKGLLGLQALVRERRPATMARK